MFFTFDTGKLIESSATLIRHSYGRRMSKKRLLALLYMADRQSLKETGRPIIGGRLVAMKYGPIHSPALDIIDGVDSNDPGWTEHFELEGDYVKLQKDIGTRRLSRYEIDLLIELQSRHAGQGDWDVADETHKFSEWKELFHGRTATIPIEKVIDAIGRSADKQKIIEYAEETKYYDGLFGPGHCP